MPRTHDAKGRSRKSTGDIRMAPLTSTTRPYFNKRIEVQFRWRTREMLESPALRVLSLSGHRILLRLELELCHHGGRDNGRLPCTYADFQEYGVHRHAIGPAIRECEALGFIRVTEHGRAGNAEFRLPNKFLLTYQPTDKIMGTDEWKRIKTMEEAEEIARMARNARAPKKTESQCRKTPVSVTESGTENGKSLPPKTGTTCLPPETDTTIDSIPAYRPSGLSR
jgi:hypothetical protein